MKFVNLTNSFVEQFM